MKDYGFVIAGNKEKNEYLKLLFFGGGFKYVCNESQYYIDSQKLASEEYDFTIWVDHVEYYEEIETARKVDKFEIIENIDEKTREGKGYIKWKKKYQKKPVPQNEKKHVIKRVLELCKKNKIKLEIIKSE